MKLLTKSLICSKCGGEGARFNRQLYNGVTQIGIRCLHCGHERIDHEYKPTVSEYYVLEQTNEVENF